MKKGYRKFVKMLILYVYTKKTSIFPQGEKAEREAMFTV